MAKRKTWKTTHVVTFVSWDDRRDEVIEMMSVGKDLYSREDWEHGKSPLLTMGRSLLWEWVVDGEYYVDPVTGVSSARYWRLFTTVHVKTTKEHDDDVRKGVQ